MVYSTETETRRDVDMGRKTRRYGLPALLLSALVAFVVGWFGGQAAEKDNDDNIPGGQATDNTPGSSRSDN